MIAVDETMQTNVPNIWAIGDVTGKLMYAHVATHQGLIAAENILGNERFMEYDAVPGITFTRPEVASCGLSKEKAKEKAKEQARISEGGRRGKKFRVSSCGLRKPGGRKFPAGLREIALCAGFSRRDENLAGAIHESPLRRFARIPGIKKPRGVSPPGCDGSSRFG
jgi:hypothetical protein